MNHAEFNEFASSMNARTETEAQLGKSSTLTSGLPSTIRTADNGSKRASQINSVSGQKYLRSRFPSLRADKATELAGLHGAIEDAGEESSRKKTFSTLGLRDFLLHLIRSVTSAFPTSTERVALWLQSRENLEDNRTIPTRSRPMTARNLTLAIRLAPAVFSELLPLYWEATRFQLVIYLLGTIITGILPAWQALVLARLLDCVQDAMSGSKTIDQKQIIWLAGLNLAATHSHDIIYLLLQNNDRFIRETVDQKFEYLHLKAQLFLDFPTLSNPRVAPLLNEAAAFAGFGNVASSEELISTITPSNRLMSLTRGLTNSISILSQSTILLTTILGTSKGPVTFSTIAFLAMSFLPALLGIIHFQDSRSPSPPPPSLSKREVLEMVGNRQYKQEILSFSLADWVIEKWNQANKNAQTHRRDREQSTAAIALSLIRNSIETIGYASIALGAFPSAVSIANMRLCQSSATSLIHLIRSYHYHISDLLTFVFLATAFLESLRMEQTMLKPKEDLTIYEPVTHADGRKGMRIVAKDLSFCYPGQTVPTLKNINLTVEPGETLAIVGFNGGGKTTLVKVLMGLFDYEGTLLINDKHANSYVRASLHARTTVCFQDYTKYNLTIRENVGTGNYPRMDDKELLNKSLKRGGADIVVAKFPAGVEQHLSKRPTLSGAGEAGPPSVPIPLTALSSRETAAEKGPALLGTVVGGTPPAKGSWTWSFFGFGGRSRIADRIQRQKIREQMLAGLSGGQWQRIALSRAFMRSDEADLVVFDEPSASLDARAEHELFERIHGLSIDETGNKIRTTIYVSHRFSTTRRADKIAVVEDGTISEVGSHEQLMALGGRYAEFFNLQAKAFVD